MDFCNLYSLDKERISETVLKGLMQNDRGLILFFAAFKNDYGRCNNRHYHQQDYK